MAEQSDARIFIHSVDAAGNIVAVKGLIRWYLPKGTDFSKISDEQIAKIELLINNRPRKCLGFRKPIEVAAPFVALRG